MAFTGQAKADYMRDYMRRRRAGLVRPSKTDKETEALKAEIEALKAELAAARQTKSNDNPSVGIDGAKLDGAHPSHREAYDKASADVRTWLNSFATLPRKDAKDAHQLFLCLTAIEALPMGKVKPRKRAAEAPAKVEEPQQEPAALNWIDAEHGTGAEADTPAGHYFFWNPDSMGLATFFTPSGAPKGDSRYSRRLGNFDTPAEAKAACEEHARSYVRPTKRPTLRALRDYASCKTDTL
jgi:hypothetical protein